MGKRMCPFDDNEPAIKQQLTYNSTTRKIKSNQSEKTLQMLYQGANKQFNSGEDITRDGFQDYQCVTCDKGTSYKKNCWFCEKNQCSTCVKTCLNCKEEFCDNCSFFVYEQGVHLCYSCY